MVFNYIIKFSWTIFENIAAPVLEWTFKNLTSFNAHIESQWYILQWCFRTVSAAVFCRGNIEYRGDVVRWMQPVVCHSCVPFSSEVDACCDSGSEHSIKSRRYHTLLYRTTNTFSMYYFLIIFRHNISYLVVPPPYCPLDRGVQSRIIFNTFQHNGLH